MNFNNINPGELISYTDYLTVKSVNPREGSIEVENSTGQSFTVRGKSLIEGMNSGSQYTETKKVSRTQLAEVLQSVGDKVFTVVFDKADGSERTLTGHLLNTENHMGRSNVRDLRIKTGNPLRQVDHRTLKSLVVNNIRYTVK
jgi:hypothetical protein